MNTRALLLGGISALLLGGTMVGCAGNGGGIASASDRSASSDSRVAANDAGKARAALGRRDGPTAIGFAERAVALTPRSAEYRSLLGQSYLQDGRFASATHAFADTLRLAPGDGKAALNLALAQVATGDWQAARQTLAANATLIAAPDRGLALSLAGDTAGGIAVLTDAARSPQTSVKVRQNLALSFALAGRWQEARVVAAADMAPADVDARLEHWATFAQPAAASDQVAELLGVRAKTDGGQPIALALTAPDDAFAVTSAAPAADQAIAAAEVAPTPSDGSRSGFSKVVFAPRQEIVQSLPAMMLRPTGGPIKVAAGSGVGSATAAYETKSYAFAKTVSADGVKAGAWFVQLGAFESAGVAKDAWGRATRRSAVLAGHAPNGMNIRVRGEQFYRLSIGGFNQSSANTLCRRYRAEGGACFVRRDAGDAMAQWLRPLATQLAAR